MLVAHIAHSFVELFARKSYGLTEINGVEVMYFQRYHHYVVSRLVVHDNLAVAVVDNASRRVNGLAKESVGVGVILIFIVGDLQTEQSHKVYDGNDYDKAADYVFAFFKIIVFSHVGKV